MCKVSTKLEEYKSKKGFFESLFLERGDSEVKFQDTPEFSKNLPPYFDNADYIISLFSQFNNEEFENVDSDQTNPEIEVFKCINNFQTSYERNL